MVTAERKTAEERRDEIVDAAFTEFAATGLYGTSTEAIARRAGVSQPYLFRLFGTKKELFIAAVNRCFRTTLERLVDFSTSEVFGTHAYKVEETHVTSQPSVGEARWTYAVSKLAGEYLAHSYYDEFGLPAATLRPFNVYGPGQIGGGAIRAFTEAALAGEDLVIHGDGSQIRAWCYVDDLVDALLLILEREEAVGQVFNIGNARSVVTIYDLALRIRRLTGAEVEIVQRPLHYMDVEMRIPNIDKARKLLDWEAQVDLDDGLARTIAWYREQVPLTQL